MYPPAYRPFYEGWRAYQALVIDALRELTPEQLAFRTAPTQWAVWQIAAHMAGARAWWFHDNLGEGDPTVRDLFRVERTTVAGFPLDQAGWEDVEDDPKTAAGLVDGLERTWALMDACLQRWTPDDLETQVQGASRTHQRGWVVWHVMEHDLHHGGEISQVLGSNGLAGFDL